MHHQLDTHLCICKVRKISELIIMRCFLYFLPKFPYFCKTLCVTSDMLHIIQNKTGCRGDVKALLPVIIFGQTEQVFVRFEEFCFMKNDKYKVKVFTTAGGGLCCC